MAKKKTKQRVKKARPKAVGKITARGIGCPGVSMFQLDQLKLAGYNPREIEVEALESLTNSISRFGCVEPIIVNTRRGNTIIGGHQRFEALKRLKATECICVTISCTENEEKLLNLTLNNPKVQGRFIDDLARYIEELEDMLPADLARLDLQIEQLRAEIAVSDETKTLPYKEEEIQPYKKTHILLSFDPVILIKIYAQLEALVKEPGVEYEQCSN